MNDLHYAVVIGIDRYPGISDLTGAKADAGEFAEWLQQPEGGALPEQNVHLVIRGPDEERAYENPQAAEPRQDDVDDALQAVVDSVRVKLQRNRSSWTRTRLYLYVAGHGCAPEGSEGAFLLANARPGAYTRNIDLGKYRLWFSACAWFSEVVVFADCCRTRVKLSPKGTGPHLDPCPQPFVDREPTWVMGYATESGGRAYEDPFGPDDEARGHFTRALLSGLRGSAADQTGAVTAVSLRDYVSQIVADTTRERSYPQRARFPHDTPASFVFRAATAEPSRATWPVTIAFPSGFGGRVVLRLDLTPVATHDADQGPLVLDLQEGLYEVAPDDGEPAAAFSNDGLFKVSGEATHVQL
jgi:uncharacterized caspase-like protein